MDDIIVDTYKLNYYAQRLGKVNLRLARLDRRLNSLYLRVGLLGLWNLIQADAMTCYSRRIVRCQSYLRQTAADFEITENRLTKLNPENFRFRFTVIEPPMLTNLGPGGKLDFSNFIAKMIGKVGFIGCTASVFLKPFARWMVHGKFDFGITNPASAIGFLKDGVVPTLKGIQKWSKSNRNLDKLARMLPDRAHELRIKRLLGLDNMFSGKIKASVAKSWSMRFNNNFNKILSKELESYTSGGAKAAFAWLGVGLTAVSNAFSNYNEYKSGKINTGRAVAETVTETVIDLGKGLLIGAAVAAGTAAAVGSAPVIAVGAISVGLTLGLDWVSKKITGKLCNEEKGFTEVVSDFVLDVGEKAYNVGKKTVSSAVSFLKKGFSKLKPPGGRGFKPLFSF